jgi:hypothetical protein
VRRSSTGSGAQRRRDADDAFDPYTDALDREERAANIYVRLMRRLGRLVDTGLAPQPCDAPSGHRGRAA